MSCPGVKISDEIWQSKLNSAGYWQTNEFQSKPNKMSSVKNKCKKFPP